MKNLYGVLHGILSIRFYGLLEFVSCPPQRGRPNAIMKNHDNQTITIEILVVILSEMEEEFAKLAKKKRKKKVYIVCLK